MDEKKHDYRVSRQQKASSPTSALDYDKIQCISSSSNGGSLGGFGGVGVVASNGRDAFSWDDSCFSLAASEMDTAKESLFEAMRSG